MSLINDGEDGMKYGQCGISRSRSSFWNDIGCLKNNFANFKLLILYIKL